MRKFKKVLALTLALVMVLSCLSGVSAASREKVQIGAEQTLGTSAKEKGALSREFQQNNSYKYAENEIVRAIVVLESAPVADFEGTEAEKSAYRIKLTNEQNRVRKAMTMNYEIAYEFTSLLNGFSCDVAYGDLEKIAEIEGVASVHIANSYAEPKLEIMPKNNVSGQINGNLAMNNSGFDGEGIVIAVLDTGLRTTHEAFQVYESMPITETLTEDDLVHAVAPGKYISAKVPFAYDYAMKDNDVTDFNGHGTHVSGTALGYSVSEEGEEIMRGGAPAAQLVSMKIFKDEGGGTSSDIYFYALEDAYRLGVDVVNMSIGAQNGFTYDESLESTVFGNMYKRMEAAGIAMCVAAGNEYSMAYYSSVQIGGNGYVGVEYPDFGTIASPAAYEGNISIASMENYAYPDFVIHVGGEAISFIDSCTDGEHGWFDNFADSSTEMVVLKNAEGTDLSNGYAEDYEGVDVTDKIAIVSRGDITFQEKADFAAAAGAVGVIVVNNQEGRISMSITPFPIPAISVDVDARALFLAAEAGDTVYTPLDKELVENPDGFTMSAFSNWGTSPMLTIDPMITSIGGRVYSAYKDADDYYEVASGTSMASPNGAGTVACLLQALNEYGYAIDEFGAWQMLTKQQRLDRAVDLLASSGIILADADGYIYSVRKQGAGLANSADAITLYGNAAYITNPIQELGDDKEKTGVYTMDIELNNESLNDVTYSALSAYVLYDYPANAGGGFIVNTQTSDYIYFGNEGDATVTYMIDGEEVTEVTVLSGQKVTVSVTIELSAEMKAFFDAYYTNGAFVEGYINFATVVEEGSVEPTYETHATFLAFYGDWTQGPALESANSFDFVNAYYEIFKDVDENNLSDEEEAALQQQVFAKVLSENRYYTDINWAYTANSENKLNNYLGANMLDWAVAPLNPDHIAISTPKHDGTWNYSVKMTLAPSLLRNARHIVMTVTDKETGEVYMTDDTEYIPKDAYDYENGYWAVYSVFEWDGTKADKSYVPSGTVATVNFDVQLPYGEADDIWQESVWSFDITVDYTAPVIESVVYDEEAQTVTVKASDENYLAGIYLCSLDYETIYEIKSFSSDVKGESFEAVFDVSELDAKAVIATAMDYATNENEYVTYFFEEGLDATLTLVTAEGEQSAACVTGDEIKLPEAPSYDGYTFTAWVPERIAESDGSDIEEFYFAGEYYTVTKPESVLYALYAKGTVTTYEDPTYILNEDSFGAGYWAFVGWPYGDDGFDPMDPIALGKDLGNIRIADQEDGVIFEEEYGFSTENFDLTWYAQYFEEYDAYALITLDKEVLMDYAGTLMTYPQLYLEGLWKVKIEEGNVYVYNYAEPTHILVYDDINECFAIYDDTVPIDGDLTASGYFNLFAYEYTESKMETEYYTTEYTVDVEEPTEPEAQDIVILYTNDIHTYINNDGLKYSNIAALKADLEAQGKAVILIDAGDHIQGTAYGSMDKGETIIDLMNATGYDLATLGNHEFDYGMARALEVIDKAAYPYVSANFYHEADGVRGENVLDSFKIFELGGLNIAIVGITTPETFTKTTPAYFMDEEGNYIYGISAGDDGSDLYADVQAAVDAAWEAGADYVIALGHLGDDPASDPWNSEDVIANVSGLDAFIDGHSHSTVEGKDVLDKDGYYVRLTQTGQYLDAVGMLTISDSEITTELITAYEGVDEEVKAIEDAWAVEVDELLGEIIAYSTVDFKISDETGRLIRKQETNLGDFTADALYYLFDVTEGLGVDAAIMNGGGIRANMDEGFITYKTTKTVHTFGNVACLIEVTGQQILDALEWGAKNVGVGENGGFLQVSGITYEIHSYIPSTVQADDKGVWAGAPTGEYRVKNVTIGGEDLDVTKTYKLAGYNYTLRDMGDGFAMFDGAVNVKDYVMEDYMVLANYAKSFPKAGIKADNSVLGANYGDIYGEGRIVIYPECPHYWDEGVVTTEPACEDAGVMTYTCTECGATYTEALSALGHTEEILAAVEPTCTATGLTEGVICSVCEAVITAQEEIPALGHAYDEGVITTEPTCVEAGIKTFTCATCGETETEAVEALGHTEIIWEGHEATCVWTGLTEGKSCSTCGEELVAQEEIPMTEHTYENHYCTFCGEEDPEDPIVLPFEDVVESAWYYPGVKFMYANGIMNGVSETEFNPMGEVTRAMMVTVLWRMFGSPEAETAATFTDVDADAWYAEAVAWAQAEGIVLGITEELFAPHKAVTREQIATILWRACGEEEVEAELTFTDADTVSPWAEAAMKWAVAYGLFHGDNEGNLKPTATATRAQLATILYRF